MSAFFSLAAIPLARASHMLKPRACTGGDHPTVWSQETCTNWGGPFLKQSYHRALRACMFVLLLLLLLMVLSSSLPTDGDLEWALFLLWASISTTVKWTFGLDFNSWGMAFPELGILGFSGQNTEAGPKVTKI